MNVYVLYLTTGLPPGEESEIVQGVFYSLSSAVYYLKTHPFIAIYNPSIKEMYMIMPQRDIIETPSHS